MFIVFDQTSELDFFQLVNVYEESNLQLGERMCPNEDKWTQLRIGEDELRASVSEFLREDGSVIAVWAPNGCYRAALRLERYEDGYLLSCLETAVDSRGKGYASELVKRSLVYLFENGVCKVYAHIRRDNRASLAVHRRNGFVIVKKWGRLLDGSICHDYYTLLCEK